MTREECEHDADRQHERTTFLEVGQILERTSRYARRARELLVLAMEGAPPTDERERLFLERLVALRAEFEADLARAEEGVSPRLLGSLVQYSVDPWDRDPDPPACFTIEEATRWLLRLDEKLVQTYAEVAGRTDNDPNVKEFFGSLALLVGGFDRGLAREASSARDL